MRGKTVLVVSRDTANRRRIGAPLASAGNQVVRADSAEAAIERLNEGGDKGPIDLALVDHDTVQGIPSILEVAGQLPVVALSSRAEPQALLELVCDHGVHNLLAGRRHEDGDVLALDPAEVLVTVEKIFRADVFGVNKYLPGFGVELESHVLTRATERDSALDRLSEFVRGLGANKQLASTASVVADELLTNAIYNAPRDLEGRPRYAETNRRTKITLDPHEYVELSIGSNGQKFALSVTDQFGAFRGAQLRHGLKRCLSAVDPIEQKAGGAGIGLYMVLRSCSQFVINVAPGERTEMIAIWELDKRLRGARQGGHSLHLFAAGSAASQPLAAPVAAREAPSRRRAARDTDVGGFGIGDPAAADTSPGAPLSSFEQAEDTAPTAQVVAGAIDSPRASPPPEAPVPVPEVTEPEGLEELRGVLLLRERERPALPRVLARIREAATADEAVTAALAYVCSRWSAVALLRRHEGRLGVWCAGGDVHDWEGLQAASVRAEDLRVLTSYPRIPAVETGPVAADPVERWLASLLLGHDDATGLILSVSLELPGELVVFAANPDADEWRASMPYERLLWQLVGTLQELRNRAAIAS